MAKKPKTITAAEFDRKFDAGEDVEEYLDLANARRPGREQERVSIEKGIAHGERALEQGHGVSHATATARLTRRRK